jgi:quinol monooxygenase YgiN
MVNDVTVTISMSVKPDKLETLLSMIPDLLKETIARPGVLSARALRNPDESLKLMFLDVFASVEASNAYFGWRRDRGDLDRLVSMLSEPPRIDVWPVSIDPV